MGEATVNKKGYIMDILGIKVIQDGSSVKEIVAIIKFVVSGFNTPIVIKFYGFIDSSVFDRSIRYSGKVSCGSGGRKIVQSFSYTGNKSREVKFEAIFHDPNNQEEISEKDLESLLYTVDVG